MSEFYADMDNSTTDMMSNKPKIFLNTSNKDKLAEYQQYLSNYSVTVTNLDLEEPQADPLTIMRYKASQFENVLVDDVSFDVFNETSDDIQVISPGSNIRWALENLKNPIYLGKNAVFSCLLAIQRNKKVYIYAGRVNGRIVSPRGSGFGFGPCFLPDGVDKTLGEFMDPNHNARYLALQNFINNKPEHVLDCLKVWEGPFQTS